MSSALLQILAQGEEDAYITSESFDSLRPFRQVVKKATAFSTEIIDIDVRFPTTKTYGQTLSNIVIPRKGDLIRDIYVRLKVKRASGTTKTPGLEILDKISMWAGNVKLETITGEYIYARDAAHLTADELHARDRLVDFNQDEGQGTVKTMYIRVPFFTSKTPLPLIAVQNQNVHLELTLRDAMASLDPVYQPDVDVMVEYVYVDDDERRFFTNNEHALLIERLQSQEDPFNPRQSVINRVYSPVIETLGGYDRVEGSGADKEIAASGTYLQLVNNQGDPKWFGRTEVFYDCAENARVFDIQGRFLIPTDTGPGGTVGLQWATFTEGGTTYGYSLEWSFPDYETITTTFKRNGEVVCTIANASVTSQSGYATVTASDTSTDFTTQAAAGEAWLVFQFQHHLENDLLSVSTTVEGYVAGGYVASLSPVSTGPTITHTIREGYSAIYTFYRTCTFSIFADATEDVIFAADSIRVDLVALLPSSSNYNMQNIPLYFRGPVRYLMWYLRPLKSQWTFGKYTTDVVGSETQRQDVMHSAKVTLNAKDRTALATQTFYNVVEPLRIFKKSLPAGLHVFGFCEGPAQGLMPNGTVNLSRIQETRLVLQLRSYNPTESILTRLDESECLEEGRLYTRLVCHAIGYNVLFVADGSLKQAYM